MSDDEDEGTEALGSPPATSAPIGGRDGGGSAELDRRHAARDDVLVDVLAQGASYAEAASRARCSSRTVGRRMADAAFRGRVEDLRSQWVSRTSGELTALGPAAVEVLRELLGTGEQNVKLRAAREVLSQGFRSRQLHDLELEVREIRAELERLRRQAANGDVDDR